MPMNMATALRGLSSRPWMRSWGEELTPDNKLRGYPQSPSDERGADHIRFRWSHDKLSNSLISIKYRDMNIIIGTLG
jgi:hypothetical protein